MPRNQTAGALRKQLPLHVARRSPTFFTTTDNANRSNAWRHYHLSFFKALTPKQYRSRVAISAQNPRAAAVTAVITWGFAHHLSLRHAYHHPDCDVLPTPFLLSAFFSKLLSFTLSLSKSTSSSLFRRLTSNSEHL